jgi:hypothetical protein
MSSRDETSGLCGAVGWTDERMDVMCCVVGASFCCWLLERNDVSFKPRPLLDLKNSALNLDHYCIRRIDHDVEVHPAPACLYMSLSSFCSGCQFTQGVPIQVTSPSLPLFAAFSLHSYRLHHAHGTSESRASRTSFCC